MKTATACSRHPILPVSGTTVRGGLHRVFREIGSGGAATRLGAFSDDIDELRDARRPATAEHERKRGNGLPTRSDGQGPRTSFNCCGLRAVACIMPVLLRSESASAAPPVSP